MNSVFSATGPALPSLRGLPLQSAYSTGTSDLFTAFYLPSLSVSTRYDRAAGFFRSSLFVIAGLAFSDFARRGGKTRIVCSHAMAATDKDAIETGLKWRVSLERAINDEVARLLGNPEDAPVAQFLATLVAVGALDLRIAIRPSQPGIFHDKVGIFHDRNDAISFVGSANETLPAWDPRINHEGFEVFRSWGDPGESDRVARHTAYFGDLWAGTHPGISTIELPDAVRRNLLHLEDPRGIDSAAVRVRRHLGSTEPQPTSAYRRRRVTRPLDQHQKDVVASWEKANFRGIITHVTGGGKTLSALEAIRRWTRAGRPALVVVPSDLLLSQWQREIALEFDEDDLEVLTAGGDSSSSWWQPRVGDFTRSTTALGARLVLATVQTASKAAFLDRIHSGPHLLLVADEVHRLGSPTFRSLLNINVGAALGLSATPRRYGDIEGTDLIHAFFGDPLEPTLDIGDAIRIHRLVPYEYHVHRVDLSADELQAWNKLSEQIAHAYAALPSNNKGERQETDRYKLLLIKRARIVKQASSKIDLAASLIPKEFQPGDRWLVYCDDSKQLHEVVSRIRSCGLNVYEYFSGMAGHRDATMATFTALGGVLVAIKCLDEGVDIPLINKALILASSSNPREFVQRRGRVLRVAPGKFSATIHDAIVLPKVAVGSSESAPSYARTDLARAAEFAKNARNVAVALQLRVLASEMHISAEDLVRDSYEDEDTE